MMTITIREPGSAITHFIGMVLAIFAATPLLLKAQSGITLTAMSIFIISMILLYGSSATYHAVSVSDRILKRFRKLDHCMIFVLIAGSYTPICLLVLGQKMGIALLAFIWSVALVGMVIKIAWITCPKWFSSILYIVMGWTCVFVFQALVSSLSPAAIGWLVAGGVIYTIGGIIYALKLPIFNSLHKNFGSHEIFHLFVMGGSFCHFMFMYLYLA